MTGSSDGLDATEIGRTDSTFDALIEKGGHLEFEQEFAPLTITHPNILHVMEFNKVNKNWTPKISITKDEKQKVKERGERDAKSKMKYEIFKIFVVYVCSLSEWPSLVQRKWSEIAIR